MTQLAKYVKEMRRQFGLTQVDLSQKSGVGLRFVRELEQGKSGAGSIWCRDDSGKNEHRRHIMTR